MEYQSDQDCYNITMFTAEGYLGNDMEQSTSELLEPYMLYPADF